MANNNVQNVRFLRNGSLYATREAALTGLNGQSLSAEQDGSIILARYGSGNAVKTLVGLVYVNGENKSLTIFDIEGASADVEALRQEINAKLGDGVTSANTATAQLAALNDRIDALDMGPVAEAGKPIVSVGQTNGLVSATAGTINAEFVNYAGTTAHTATTVEAAIDYLYETIDNFEDFNDTPVEGQYVSEVSFVDGRPQISRVALPNATTVADDNKIVSDVTQTNGQITATAKNLTAVKLDGYAEAAATGDVATTDTLGEALGKLQKTIHEMDKAADAVAGQVVTTVSEADGVVSETKANVKDLQLGGYAKDTTATGDIASTDTINAALSKLENKAAAITIANADGSINVTTGATGTDINVNIKSGEKVLAKDGGNGIYTDLDLVKITTGLPETVKERYQLLATDNSQIGADIDIPKDSHIVSIIYNGETQKLTYTYINDSGNTASTDVDMSELVLETEFGSGVTVTDHVAHGVVDPTSENFLTVGAGGFKLSGVQDAINTAISGLDFTSDVAVAGQYVAAIEETDGVVAVKTRENVSEAVLNNYAKGSDATAVAATDTVNQAISKLENQVDAVDGLVDALSAKTFTEATSSNASISTAVTAAADGTKSVDLITDADKIKMSGFTNATSLSAITTDDSIATAFEKAASAIDAAKAASTTEVVEGTDAGNNMTITPTTSQTDGHVTYTISLTDVASDAALTAEIAARKAVDGQNGDTYAANSSANYISGATSLNDADVKLDTQVKANADAITQNKVVAGNGIEVGTPAATGTSVSVKIDNTTYPGGSALAADTNGLRITSIDCGTY